MILPRKHTNYETNPPAKLGFWNGLGVRPLKIGGLPDARKRLKRGQRFAIKRRTARGGFDRHRMTNSEYEYGLHKKAANTAVDGRGGWF